MDAVTPNKDGLNSRRTGDLGSDTRNHRRDLFLVFSSRPIRCVERPPSLLAPDRHDLLDRRAFLQSREMGTAAAEKRAEIFLPSFMLVGDFRREAVEIAAPMMATCAAQAFDFLTRFDSPHLVLFTKTIPLE
jgi:hypothetical protein